MTKSKQNCIHMISAYFTYDDFSVTRKIGINVKVSRESLQRNQQGKGKGMLPERCRR